MFFGYSFHDFLTRLRRNPSDGISFVAFHFALFGIFQMIMSEDAALWSKKYLFYHQIFAYFITANIFISLWSLALTDASGRKFIYTDENVRLGWELCWRCESHKPHRAHHCYQCRTCILKRDHHCIFAVNCVGYANMRYFYTLLCWTWIGVIYANIVNYEFLVKILMDFSWYTVFSFVAPLLAWLFGLLHENFISVILASIALGAFLYTTFLLKVHYRSFVTGVTLSEMNRLKFEYKTTWKENMRDVFGANWPIAWISPLIPSKQDGDGTHYTKPDKSKHQRTI